MRWSQDACIRALDFAARAHSGQLVPGKPYSYVVHLTTVAMEVMAVLADSEGLQTDLALQCALLHDVLEDTPVGADELEAAFGPEVCRGVQALTKDKRLPKIEQMEDSLQRILCQPAEVGLVKMADRTTNLAEPPAGWPQEKIRAYHAEALLIWQHLQGCSPLLADRLKQKLNAYRRYFS